MIISFISHTKCRHVVLLWLKTVTNSSLRKSATKDGFTRLELQTPIPPMSSKGVSDVLQDVLPVAARGKQIDSNTVEVQNVTLLKTDYENPSGDCAPRHPVFLLAKRRT